MEFNPSKCQVIHITRSKNPIPTQYTLHNCLLESVSSAKYLGIDISSDLSWDTHINRISKKANNTLGFLRRNIKIHSESLNTSVYKVLVRPQLEYCCTVWCPFTDSNISIDLKLSNVELPDGSNMTIRACAGIRQWLKKSKNGSRKIKLAQTYEKYDFLNTLRLYYNAVLYNADSACSSIMCVKMSADDRGIHNASFENGTRCVFPSQV